MMLIVALSYNDFTSAFDLDRVRSHLGDPLRLKGGWARGETKQRKFRVPLGRAAIPNHPRAISKRPCSGPKAVTQLERLHGIDVVRAALYTASPMSKFFDPRTAVLRMGLRLDRWDTNQKLRLSPHNDTSMMLLKAAYFGVEEIIKPLIESGADINYLGKPVSRFLPDDFSLLD